MLFGRLAQITTQSLKKKLLLMNNKNQYKANKQTNTASPE